MQFRRLDGWREQFRRICYPINDEEPTPALPKGGRADTHLQPLPKGGGQGTSTYTFRRICYPPAWSMRIYYPTNNNRLPIYIYQLTSSEVAPQAIAD